MKGGRQTKTEGTWGALLMSLIPREPTDMVMTAGNKADGILVGMDGKYSSMAADFRSSEHENAYENIPEEEVRVQVTPM